MARPRLTDSPDEENATERDMAPDTTAAVVEPPPVYVPPAPRQMRVERQGSRSEPYTRRFPQVRGGTCEYCGVLDPNTPAQYQYKLCPHYRGMDLRCTYCPENKNPDDVVYHSSLNIAEHPDNPGLLVVWCDSYECSRAHEQRFKRAV